MTQFRYVPDLRQAAGDLVSIIHGWRANGQLDLDALSSACDNVRAALSASPLPPPYDEGEIARVIQDIVLSGGSILSDVPRAIIEYLNGRDGVQKERSRVADDEAKATSGLSSTPARSTMLPLPEVVKIIRGCDIRGVFFAHDAEHALQQQQDNARHDIERAIISLAKAVEERGPSTTAPSHNVISSLSEQSWLPIQDNLPPKDGELRTEIIRILWEKQFEGSPWAGKFHLIRPDSLADDYGPLADKLIEAVLYHRGLVTRPLPPKDR